ncbi:hypothetical protein [Herbaspirillum rubrisubalbicans]
MCRNKKAPIRAFFWKTLIDSNWLNRTNKSPGKSRALFLRGIGIDD